MVEFAVAAGAFTFLLLGIIEFGLAVWQRNSAAADAREGARFAIVHGSTSGQIATAATIKTHIKSKSVLDTIRVYATWPDGNAPGKEVRVSVVHDVPRRGPFIPAHKDSATSRMIVLY
jgi:Flp pilus assembly protein TadG